MRTCRLCSNEAIGQQPASLYWAYDGLCMECYDQQHSCPFCSEPLTINTGYRHCDHCDKDINDADLK